MTATQGLALQRFMTAAWSAFMAACVLELLVFALVDPMELGWVGHQPLWSRQGVYTVAFFAFWGVVMASNLITLFLCKPAGAVRDGV
ncbi:membrane protein [soil metagenome]